MEGSVTASSGEDQRGDKDVGDVGVKDNPRCRFGSGAQAAVEIILGEDAMGYC